jgi:hypothetical protein
MAFTKQLLSIGGGIGIGVIGVWSAGLWRGAPKPPHRIAIHVNDLKMRSDPAAPNPLPKSGGDESGPAQVVTTRLEPIRPEDPAARSAARREQAQQHLAALRAQDEALLKRLATEPYDSKWAPDATDRISSGLKQLMTGRHFTVDAPKCQSTACAVTVHWSDGAVALQELSSVVEYGYGLDDCARGLTFPKSDFAPGETVSAPLVFDCSRRLQPPAPRIPRSG